MRRLPRIDALAAGMEQLAADLRAGEVVIVHRADLADAVRALTEGGRGAPVDPDALSRLIDAADDGAARKGSA